LQHRTKKKGNEELKARIEQSEQQFAEGKYQDFDEAMDELEREFAEEEKVLIVNS